MALWKAGGGSLNKEFDFRSWHCGKARRGSLNKEPCPLPMWPNVSQDKPNMHPTCPPGLGAVAGNAPLGPRWPTTARLCRST